MRRAVAFLLTSTMMLGCFPHDAHKRTLAQLAEGGAVVGGIALEAALGTGADCDAMTMIGAPPDSNCHTNKSVAGGVGVALILGGLLGFVATISTAEEDKEPPKVDIKAQDQAGKADLKLPPGVKGNTQATDTAAKPSETPAAATSDATQTSPAVAH